MNRETYMEYRKKLNFNFRYARFFEYLLVDAVLWGATIFFMTQSLAIAWLAAFPIAALMFRNFAYMHEAVHNAGHSNSKANYFLGLVTGSICFMPYSIWKTIHVEHHYWAGNFRKDPALTLILRYPNETPLTKQTFEMMWKTRFPWMASFQYVVFWAHSTARLMKSYRDVEFWVSYVAPVALWVGLVCTLHSTQLIALAGGILVYSLLFDYINMAHHCGVDIRESYERKPTWQQLEIARTGRYPDWLEYLILNFNFHAEHHMVPDLPWHELKKAHNLLKESGESNHYAVVGPGWLREQRKKTFSAFFRPDLYGKEGDTKKVA